MEEFRGSLDDARRLYREGREATRAGRGNDSSVSPRFLREWALFEKRAGDLEVTHLSSLFWSLIPCRYDTVYPTPYPSTLQRSSGCFLLKWALFQMVAGDLDVTHLHCLTRLSKLLDSPIPDHSP